MIIDLETDHSLMTDENPTNNLHLSFHFIQHCSDVFRVVDGCLSFGMHPVGSLKSTKIEKYHYECKSCM